MWCGPLYQCYGDPGGPFFRSASAGLPSLGACGLVTCPLGVIAPRGVSGSVGWGVVASSGALGHLQSCPSASLPSPVLGVAAVSSSPPVPVPLPVWLPLRSQGSSRGGGGVVVGCPAVFSATPRVGVAPSPRVGVPSFPCAGSGGRWARAGAVRAASDPCCGGASRWACASGGRAVWTGGGAVPVPALWRALPVCAPRCPSLRPLPLCHGPWPFLFLALLVVSCPRVVLPPVPCPFGRLLATLCLSVPPLREPSLSPFPS